MAASSGHPRAPHRLVAGAIGARLRAVAAAMPTGRPLGDERWEARHRGIAVLLWAHAPALFAMALLTGRGLAHGAIDVLPVVACGVVAVRRGSRHLRSTAATLGLVAASAALVHLSGGNIEMHFHFFVIVGVITLYHDWVPFGLALAFVVLHHGVLGVLAPSAVYNHPGALAQPWLWAAIHGAFLLAASVAHILAWRLNEDQALLDELTRLPNRTLLTERMRLSLTRRAADGRDVTLLFVDLDGFKNVNDTLGHAAGDRLLVEVGNRIKATVRHTDTAARLGGDEFAVLLDGSGTAAAMQVAERILASLGTAVRLPGHHERVVSASIGVAAVAHETAVDDVLRNADLAMYMAKAAGRGRIEVFQNAMFDEAVDRADLERDLREAVARHTLTVAYQPCVDLADGRVTGVEALLRWSHPERGDVPPSVFVPMAETTGLIVDLGRQVLRTACVDAVRLRDAVPDLTVAVNVSARQLAAADFPADVAAALHDSGLPASALVLEITESMLVHDVEASVRRLTELKTLGLRVAIDDFGTGYSSLSYLRHFPVDILKIDRLFVEQLDTDGAALARSIVRLGQALHLDVIAEGVELEAQRAQLRRLGCRLGQGYLFARPSPVGAVESALRAGVAPPLDIPAPRPAPSPSSARAVR